MRIIKDEEQNKLLDQIHQSFQEHLDRMSKVKSTIDTNARTKRRRTKSSKSAAVNKLNLEAPLPATSSSITSPISAPIQTQPQTRPGIKPFLAKQIESAIENTKLAEGTPIKVKAKKPLQLKKEASVPLNVYKTVSLNKFSLLQPAILQKNHGKSLTKTYSATVATTFRNVSAQRERMLVEVLKDKLSVAAQKNFTFEIPENVLVYYSQMINVFDEKLIFELLRPCVYLNFMSRGNRNFGRMEFQLFTEACPGIVYKFIEGVSGNEFERIDLKRIFTNLWIEASLTMDLTDKNIPNSAILEHSFRALNHRLGPGVISFPVRHVFGSCNSNSLSFTISLKPLDVIYGQRVPFGIIRKGHWILEQLHTFSTKTGKMTEEIYVSDCGLL